MAGTTLTIVTVVFRDWLGLSRTIASARHLREAGAEHWVIDGSRDGSIKARESELLAAGVHYLCEPDDGIYDAMNKGLDRASGRHVVFMNAGDEFTPLFTLDAFREHADKFPEAVLIGYAIERWDRDAYLHPGIGNEGRALEMPQHQATFYPQSGYSKHRYVPHRPIGADGEYTANMALRVGAAFIPLVVCSFFLGGRSSAYDLPTLRLRFIEYRSAQARVKTVAKATLWRLLPRRIFYRLLALGKFTRLSSSITLPQLEPTSFRLQHGQH